MRRIIIPHPVIFLDPLSQRPVQQVDVRTGVSEPAPAVSFASHAVLVWLNTAPFADAEGISRLPTLIGALRKLQPGEAWDIEDADYKRLCAGMQHPNEKEVRPPLFAMQLVGFARAVLEAQSLETTTP